MLRARTLLSRSPTAVLARLSQLPDIFRNNPLLFTVSTNVDGPALSDLVTALTADHGHARVGCLSGELQPGLVSCSVTALDKGCANSFRSTLPGRAATQVGRWHAIRKTHNEAGGSDEDGSYVRETSSHSDGVSAILYFSDTSPQGLGTHLREAYPRAVKLGLMAAPTPFVTGRPVTLFHNNLIHAAGAVGFELLTPTRPTASTQFSGLRPITDPVSVTRSEGNLVHELDGANPSKMLLAAIQRMSSKPDKEDEFFLGVLHDGHINAVHNIISGDPSRGTMALEADVAPSAGSLVQVFYQSRNLRVPLLPEGSPTGDKARISFVAASRGDSPNNDISSEPRIRALSEDDVLELDGDFVVASESGWVLDRGQDQYSEMTEAAWRCTAAGSTAEMSFFS